MKKRDLVTFLSDYGLEDEFVGVCHGVMLRIAPWLKVVHLHHYILRHDIRHGSIVLKQSVQFLPDAVHLAVVDPSVGSDRKAIAVRCASGAVFVGPDNGLVMDAVDECGGPEEAYEIKDQRYVLSPVSRTFQGRDLFAPAAAHIAAGVEPSELGPSVDVAGLVRLEVPEAWVHDDHVH
ncbi:MAG TPA: SAM-dependent chlorinase/fluorinase, partial [Actinomycetota bacterium]|nr:SAM-dependent chlorinase/fluorinase [Actinomycetota bacterium]